MKKAVQLIAVCTFGCTRQGCSHIHQEYSIPTAELRGVRWTEDEIAFIRDTLDETLADVALALGRTYYATAQVRSRVKRGILNV